MSFAETNVASSIYNVGTGMVEIDDTNERSIKRVSMIPDQRERAELVPGLLVIVIAC